MMQEEPGVGNVSILRLKAMIRQFFNGILNVPTVQVRIQESFEGIFGIMRARSDRGTGNSSMGVAGGSGRGRCLSRY